MSDGSENQIGERTEVYYLGGKCGPYDERHAKVSLTKKGRTEMGLKFEGSVLESAL